MTTMARLAALMTACLASAHAARAADKISFGLDWVAEPEYGGYYEAIAEGIRQTRWPGRMERLHGESVEWLLDVAHNPAGACALHSGLSGLWNQKHSRCLVFSCLRDKPAAEMARILFPFFDRVILTPIHSARATAIDDLEAAARATGSSFITAASVGEALKIAAESAQGGVAVVSGSVYLVGEARPLLLAEGNKP